MFDKKLYNSVTTGLVAASFVLIILSFFTHAEQNTKIIEHASSVSPLELGKTIYQKGILSNGQPLTAIGKDGLPFKINRTACIDCHRRSGLGSSESGILIPPITGEYLFKTTEKKGNKLLDKVGIPRPVYTQDSLKLLLKTGIRPNGQHLHEIMPRYKISGKDSDYLITYLKSLSHLQNPGLRDDQIEFATVITPGMPKEDKKLMLNIMHTYMDHVNRDVRNLGYMKSPIHNRYKPFRRWNLHVWELTGDSSSWKQQLEKKYAEQPIFAFLGGYGDWQPIHQFCEENKIPSLFPITDTPGVPLKKTNSDFYALYFSQGIKLDAVAVAKQILSQNNKKPVGNILQVSDGTAPGSIAVNTLRHSLLANKINNVQDLVISPSEDITKNHWNNILKEYKPDVIVIWQNEKQTLQILQHQQNQLPNQIYLSSRMLNQFDPEFIRTKLPLSLRENILLVHPFYMKSKEKRHLLRTQIWLRSNRIKYKKERVIANTYFCLAMLSGAIRSSSYNLNREYLIEQFEHMIDNTVYRSIYPHLSLGPDQRYASKGVYIVKMYPELEAEWIIPDN